MHPRRSLFALLALLASQVQGGVAAREIDAPIDELPPGAVARLGTSRLRHGGRIDQLVFSPDGRRLASWGGEYGVSDGVAIWDVATGKELRRTVLPGLWLDSWAWLPDGRLIAVLETKTLEPVASLYDLAATKAEPQSLPPGDNGNDRRFAVSPAGNMLAVSKNGRERRGYTIEFRELSPGQPAQKLKLLRVGQGPKEYATILKFTPDGRTLLSFTPPSYRDGDTRWTAVVWNVATAAERRRLTVTDTASPGLEQWEAVSNEQLAFGFADGSVSLYDLRTGAGRRLPNRHKPDQPEGGAVVIGTVVAFSRDGKTLVTAGADQMIRLWNVTDGKLIREFPWKKSRVVRMAVSPDGTRLALGGRDGVVRLLDARTGTEYVPQPGHESWVWSVALSPDGRIAVTTGLDRTVRIWDLGRARELRNITCNGSLEDCALTPDSKTLMAGVNREGVLGLGELHTWNVADGKEIRGPALAGAHASLVRLAPDGRRLITLWDDTVAVRSWPEGTLLHEMKMPRGGLQSIGTLLAISPDGKLLVTITRFVNILGYLIIDAAGGSIDLWEIASGKHLRTLVGSAGWAERAAFASTGEIVITSDGPLLGKEDRQRFPHGVVHVLDAGSGVLKRMFPAPSDISALAVSPDGRTAYLGSPEGTIQVSDLTSGALRGTLTGHHDQVTDLAVTADGKRLVSSSRDGSALVWDVSTFRERSR